MNGNYQHLLQFVERYFTQVQLAEIATALAAITCEHFET